MLKKVWNYKRIFCYLLSVVMVVSSLAVNGLTAFAEENNEICETIETETIVEEWESEALSEESIISDEMGEKGTEDNREDVSERLTGEDIEEIDSESEFDDNQNGLDNSVESEDITEETVEETTEIVLTEEVEEETTEDLAESVAEGKAEYIIPNVTVNEAYDKFISLTLSIGKDIVIPEDVGFYYEVEVITHKQEEVNSRIFYFDKETGNSQNVIIEMNNGFLSEGEKWTYDISVKLINKDSVEVTADTGENWIFGEAYSLSDIDVVPYYETKLTLKEGKTQIYTTQKNVAVAKIKFGKKTTARDNIKIEDISYPGAGNAGALKFEEVGSDLYVYASADNNTALGKHTVRVTADAPDGMYPAQAKITVNVVQGIEEGMLSVYSPSNRIYKSDKKTVSMSLSARFEADKDSGANAKRKKVKWEILSEEKKPFTEESVLYRMITISNGKITVNKNMIPSENTSENRFVVKVSANDFLGNEVCAYSDVIEITEEKIVAGEVVIVQVDNQGNATVTARSSERITSDKLGQIRVFKEGTPIQDTYSKQELDEWSFEPGYITYKSSNSNVKVKKDGTLSAVKPASNVRITATLNDKSKQTVSLKNLSIVYDKPQQLALKIEEIGGDNKENQIGDIVAENTEYRIAGTEKTHLRVTLMKKDGSDAGWKEVNSFVNASISVTNGTIIRKMGTGNQIYLLNMNKDNLLIKLKDKTNKKTITYKIVNTDFPQGKAPLLSLSGSLKEASYDKVQTITYNLKKNGKFKYDSANKSVYIAFDQTAMYKSDSATQKYRKFEQAMEQVEYKPIVDGKFTLTFTTNETTPLPAGKYKLWLTFGIYENGQFVPDTKAVSTTITVKTVNLEKGTYKPVTKYNISMKEGVYAKLKGEGKAYLKDTVTFSNIRNANVNGSPNAFKRYFELDENVIKLKSNLSESDIDYICKSSNKADWSGYVDYSVMVRNKDGSYSEKNGTSKITLTVKDSVSKFTASSVNAKDSKSVVKTNVYANKKKINIIYAYATKGSYTVATDGTSKLTLTPKSGKSAPVGGANSVIVYVVPEGTYEANRLKLQTLKQAWDNADNSSSQSAEEAFVKAIKQYGIKMTIKVQLPKRNVDNRAMAEEVVALVNKERTKRGLNPVAIDEEVMYVSFLRAKETERYFSHTRPNGSTCFTILDEYGISYGWAGENIACGQPTADIVMAGWMDSPGHKANILNGNFTHMGVGCYESNGIYYWVQLFISK